LPLPLWEAEGAELDPLACVCEAARVEEVPDLVTELTADDKDDKADEAEDTTDEADDEAELATDDAEDTAEDAAEDSAEVAETELAPVEEAEPEELAFRQAEEEPAITSNGALLLVAPEPSRI